MELWIRSQDKEVLTRVIDIWRDADKNEIWSKSSFAITNCLGIYKTKERVIEVLDEIEERIMLINTINIAKDRDSLIACKNVLTEEKIKGLNYPYQMPEN
jgi:hypothetical protein